MRVIVRFCSHFCLPCCNLSTDEAVPLRQTSCRPSLSSAALPRGYGRAVPACVTSAVTSFRTKAFSERYRQADMRASKGDYHAA